MNNLNNMLVDENLHQLFNYWDTDGSGYLCKSELRELCARFCITASDSDAIFSDLDRDGDGKISYEDFQSGFDDYEKGVKVSSVQSSTNHSESYENIRKALETEDIRDKVMDRSDFANRKNLKKSATNSVNGHSEQYISESFETSAESQTNAQSVIQDLLESVRNLQEENKRLAHSWMREKKEHEKHLVELEEEVDSQVKEVEIRVKQKAMQEVEAERKSMRDLMKGEMEELQTHLSMFEKVDSWLKTNQNNVQDEKVNEIRTKLEDSVHESRQLRHSLMDTQTNVALMRSELAQLRAQYEDKCRELSSEMGRVSEQQNEQQHLQRQLYLLQDANKRLQDTNDTLRSVMEFTPIQSKCSSPQLMNHSNSNAVPNRHNKRGSVIGDYIQQGSDDLNNTKTFSRLSEIDLESISTIEDEAASISQQSYASCPPAAGFQRRENDDQFDSGLSLLTRDEELLMSTSRSLQSSPMHHQLYKSKSSNSLMNSNYNQSFQGDNISLTTTLTNSRESILPMISEANGPPERTYKIIFIGDASVGKSTFILRLAKGVFVSQLSTTLGVDFQVRTYNVEGRNVALQLWDTAGQERYRSITKNYFRKADGIMLLYDVTNEHSFLSVREWINAVEEVTSKGVPVIIVGNKTDMRSTLQAQGLSCVKAEEGYKISQQYGLMFTETSCKDGNNIMSSIAKLVKIMTQNEDNLIKNAGLHLTDAKPKKFGCC